METGRVVEERLMTGSKKLQYQETMYQVSVISTAQDGLTVSVNGQDLTWRILSQRGSHITLHNPKTGQVLSGYATETEVGVSVWVAGQGIHLTKPSPVASGRNSAGVASAGFGPVLAPMPGTILKVLVGQGDTVEAKTPLVIMESMKMELTINAPQSGWISAINATPGEMVAMHASLMTLNPLESPPEDELEGP